MRKKIEELRNREEGFTLVELLAVIVILGLIVAIAIPAIGNVMDRAKSGATEAEEEMVMDAARLYITTNAITVGTTELEMGAKKLEEAGYLESRSGEASGSVTVKKDTNGKHVYTFNSGGNADAALPVPTP